MNKLVFETRSGMEAMHTVALQQLVPSPMHLGTDKLLQRPLS